MSTMGLHNVVSFVYLLFPHENVHSLYSVGKLTIEMTRAHCHIVSLIGKHTRFCKNFIARVGTVPILNIPYSCYL